MVLHDTNTVYNKLVEYNTPINHLKKKASGAA